MDVSITIYVSHTCICLPNRITIHGTRIHTWNHKGKKTFNIINSNSQNIKFQQVMRKQLWSYILYVNYC